MRAHNRLVLCKIQKWILEQKGEKMKQYVPRGCVQLFLAWFISAIQVNYPRDKKPPSGSFSYPEEVRINEIDILFLLSAWNMSTTEIKNDASPLPSEADEGWTVVQRRDKRTHCFV